MTNDLVLFSTKECPKCMKLSDYLTSMGIKYVKRVIDSDPEAETDALMNNIFSAPALKKGDSVLRTKEIFDRGQIVEDKLKQFISN